MPECNHCPATFNEETMYLAHLVEKHADDLTRIDKRRIEEHEDVTLEETYEREKLILQTLILVCVIGGLIGAVYFFVTSGAYTDAMGANIVVPTPELR